MPQGIITCRWDDRLGVVLEAKYPDDITQGLVDDDLLTIFSTHAMSESAGILAMRIKRFSIISYYTGIPETEEESQYFVALVLGENENPTSFEESLTEIAKMVIDAVGKPGFDDFYVECFDRVSKMKEITEEQRYAFIFRDEVRNLMLNKLSDGSMTKDGLAKWLSKEVEREVTDIDGLLAPLMKTDLVSELNISKGKKVSLEYVFLLRDVALIRTPHIDLFKAAKAGQMAPELKEPYEKAVEKFFKSYRIDVKDSRNIAEFISNPDTYDIIKVLREGYMTREEIPAKIGRDMPNLDRHLRRLTDENIILPLKDKKQRVWVLLLSDIQAITFFPEYMVDVIRRRWKEGTIAKEIALKHLELLRAEYISTQAPKFRKKMFSAIQDNFDNAVSNIKKKRLDQAASNLEVCANQAYDMGERKLGGHITNVAKLLREDKEKYIEEEWENDKKKILEYFEKIDAALKEAAIKKPKKTKELDLKEKPAAEVSAKATELEKGKGKEMEEALAMQKEAFTLEQSVDKAKVPAPIKKAPSPLSGAKPITEEKAVTKETAKDLKSQIYQVEKDIKDLRKQKQNDKAAELMSNLAELYKQAGDPRKAQQIYDEQNKLVIETLKDLQADLDKQAKNAEKEKNWAEAARLYGECKEISSNLFKSGQMSESEKVKEYTSLEKQCQAKLQSQ